MTPPDIESTVDAQIDAESITTAVHVISTERAALQHVENLYKMDEGIQKDFALAVKQIAHAVRTGGKLVVCGIGKSGKIGEKVVATMISLSIQSIFLHPTEALHGDLGLVTPVSPLAVPPRVHPLN
jgi:D-arabinose 5-phosphate isomerase GutQ